MMRVKLSVIAAAFAVTSMLGTATAASAQGAMTFAVTFRNFCNGPVSIQQIVLQGGMSFHVTQAGKTLQPGESWDFKKGLAFVPEKLSLVVIIGEKAYKASITPIPYGRVVVPLEFRGCLEIRFGPSPSEGSPPTGPQAPTTPAGKPLTAGMDLDQALSVLQALGMQVREEGSRDKPKLAGVDDPMLLRAIDGFSARILWVTAPGSLRAAIVWDNPTVDLDLLVFGLFPFGSCFQLTPPGVLGELCDRAPGGPVPGTVFAVLVINWTPQSQAYTLALSR